MLKFKKNQVKNVKESFKSTLIIFGIKLEF